MLLLVSSKRKERLWGISSEDSSYDPNQALINIILTYLIRMEVLRLAAPY